MDNLRMKVQENFQSLMEGHGVSLTDKQLDQFYQYYVILVEWNEKMNLTGITEISEVYIKHFYDSLTLALSFPKIQGKFTAIDVGSGAGFPGIPLKIAFPELEITFLDSLMKRINFLKAVTEQLGLQNCHFVHGRAEEIAQDVKFREKYDISIARAVARLAVLNELCLPFVRVNGSFYSMKGPDIDAELLEAKQSIKVLGGKANKTQALELPEGHGQRSIIEIKKVSPTPKKYPRKPGTPARTPLI
ncbi:16S rRNA (guanine(527)-N(7))-methyltransferase [Desulfuribacillus stibiiarsenatis]|uniref:Ribosomal RNA small subunit methyltransferase G n=1 Tax=Desulfuribacillus stibiiarsenatis TaxID=1390249 RepID=A0A1E5L964_9FIRM|nr:16S rRNA (guanine(527)-N(7))-methyltransferase RsmG [Desulfuribacillus stibiiarsenatis]OEH86483.1 16S rRNA (guanine(527)-N(7))-methyltransferase [Desulfuribacillus stibiiarsenatis]